MDNLFHIFKVSLEEAGTNSDRVQERDEKSHFLKSQPFSRKVLQLVICYGASLYHEFIYN